MGSRFSLLWCEGPLAEVSCLENPRDGGASWWAAIYGVAQSRTWLKDLAAAAAAAAMSMRPGTKNCQGWRTENNACSTQIPQVTAFPFFPTLPHPPWHPTKQPGQRWSEHSTHYKHLLHNYYIISIYVENKFPFGIPIQLYWHLVDPLIFKFLHLQRSTSESFLRLTESSCTWEFPLWQETLNGECFMQKRNVQGSR